MINRRILLSAAALTVLSTPLAAMAGGTPYTPAAFAAAQKDGQSILVVVHAPWCPTCRTQEPIIKKLLGEAKYKSVKVFVVDFDSQKEGLRFFKAPNQSTLIGFKGSKETRRSNGDTNPMNIEDLIESTL